MSYQFCSVDPRPQSREAEVARLSIKPTLGVEVTISELAAVCSLGNIDPQHMDGLDLAAIEAALTHELPPDGTILATVRADLDSVGSMAVLEIRATVLRFRQQDHDIWHESFSGDHDDCPYMRADGEFWYPEEKARIAAIATADKHGRGTWPGQRQLPRVGVVPEIESFSGVPAGLAAIVSDFKSTMGERVALMKEWILEGSCAGLTEANTKAQTEHDAAVEASEVFAVYGPNHSLGSYPCSPDDTIELCGSPIIAYVESTHRGAMGLGYHVAPIVVAMNDEFSFRGGPAGRKFTVAQYEQGHVDMATVIADLQALEPEWGGSPTICGSPQGTASGLSPEQVVSVVLEHLE